MKITPSNLKNIVKREIQMQRDKKTLQQAFLKRYGSEIAFADPELDRQRGYVKIVGSESSIKPKDVFNNTDYANAAAILTRKPFKIKAILCPDGSLEQTFVHRDVKTENGKIINMYYGTTQKAGEKPTLNSSMKMYLENPYTAKIAAQDYEKLQSAIDEERILTLSDLEQ